MLKHHPSAATSKVFPQVEPEVPHESIISSSTQIPVQSVLNDTTPDKSIEKLYLHYCFSAKLETY